ncbi:MAG: hypothetical protein HXS44_03460 [Theionarchaea archaeon]|nr:hypothetical protein [Theionarchaea archaeon]
MYCYYHPERASVAQCVKCGKNLCSECNIIKEGQSYCRECLQVSEVPVATEKIFVPALICGVGAGVLSYAMFETPFSCLCCVWIILAGALAVFLLKRFNNIKGKISMGKAAMTGGFAGFVASAIVSLALFVSEDMDAALNDALTSPELQEALRDAGMAAGDMSGIAVASLVLLAIVIILVSSLFAALGGIITNEITK